MFFFFFFFFDVVVVNVVATQQGIKLGNGNKIDLYRRASSSRECCIRWKSCQALVVDEISMISGELFDKIEYVAERMRDNSRPFGGIQVILCGDFFQLPPVFDEEQKENKFCFEADCWGSVVPRSFMLKHIFRQRDDAFIRILSEVRMGNLSEASVDVLKKCIRPPWTPSEPNEPTRLCLSSCFYGVHYCRFMVPCVCLFLHLQFRTVSMSSR